MDEVQKPSDSEQTLFGEPKMTENVAAVSGFTVIRTNSSGENEVHETKAGQLVQQPRFEPLTLFWEHSLNHRKFHKHPNNMTYRAWDEA
jgi:hypothetical protein